MWQLTLITTIRTVALLATLIILSTVCTYAQTVERHVALSDYRVSTPRSQALLDHRVYVCYYGGGLYEFDSLLQLTREVVEVDGWYITDVFVYQNNLFGFAKNGMLLVKSHDTNAWSEVGMLDCPPFLGVDGLLTATRGGTVFEVHAQSGAWTLRTIGSFGDPSTHVGVFALRGDTVLYSNDGDTSITMKSMQGAFEKSIPAYNQVHRLWALSDGSIAILGQGSMWACIWSNSLSNAYIQSLKYDSKLLVLENPQQSVIDGKLAIVGRTDRNGPSQVLGVFTVNNADSPKLVDELTVNYYDAYTTSRTSKGWLFSRRGTVALLGNSGVLRQKKWLGDTTISALAGFTFPNDVWPALTGAVSIKGSQQPALMPAANSNSHFQVIALDSSTSESLLMYKEHFGGSRFALLDQSIQVDDGTGWQEVYTAAPSYLIKRDIVLLDDSLIINKGVARNIVISRDGGRSWSKSKLPDRMLLMDEATVIDGRYYGRSYGTVFTVELDSLRDTITPKSVDIQPGSYIRIAGGTGDKLTIVAGRSFTDPAFNPKYLTHAVYYEWNHVTGTLDTLAVELQRPLTAFYLQIMLRADTTYYWSGEDARLVAITRSGIVYDTTLTFEGHRNFEHLQTTDSYVGSNGRWWLVSAPWNLAVQINPSPSKTTLVQDYARVYVQNVVPNPASTTVRVTLGRFPDTIENNIKLFIANISGEVVKDYSNLVARFPSPHSTQDVELQIGDLPSGIYLIVVSNVQSVYVQKVAIVH